MFGFDQGKGQRDELYSQDHEGKFSHEVVAGGAAFEAMRMFENRQRKDGNPVKHSFAKEIISGFAGAEVDKLVESKGMDYIDKRKAKEQAKRQAEELYDNQYSDMNEYNPNAREAHERMQY